MNEQAIVGRMNGFLHQATVSLAGWLQKLLRSVSEDWWNECVIDKLSYSQGEIAREKGYSRLSDFDLAALLRIADRNWYAMRSITNLSAQERECIKEMMEVRNRWAHVSGSIPDKSSLQHDINTLISLYEQIGTIPTILNEARSFLHDVEDNGDVQFVEQKASAALSRAGQEISSTISEKSLVYLVGQPDKRGVVLSIAKIGDSIKYTVFLDNSVQSFYEGQIAPVKEASSYSWIDLPTLQSYLSAFEINNPSSAKLYSLNSARIDFVPYQFRPALKLIKSDEPRILIADSVGVGKTIEAGLIIKELEARSDLQNVMIICPKPLVTERKWELEMKRFDEEFEPLDGKMLRQIINDTERDGAWPTRHSKTIVPYSILDGHIYGGNDKGRQNEVGLIHLDPAPHFDLVIVDEAHHIRNGSMEKEKAFAYKCVKYFCDRADAVVMLTATPLQTGDDDLFTLLNVLRPDIVIDKSAFAMMSQPNAYISRCASIIRRANDGWQEQAQEELSNMLNTQWGENVISENPLYQSVVRRLENESFTRDERVALLTDVESLHSFSTMLNRTRRKDIQDFCIRRSYTLETQFTEKQQELHDELLSFERAALTALHNVRCVPFMMSTIRRQAASCIFGLAPHIRDIITKRFAQIEDDPELDLENMELSGEEGSLLRRLASRVLALADNLPEEDTKFESMWEMIEQKQAEENNKVIIFSTFRYTLRYIKTKLLNLGYRVEQIDGSVKDEDRVAIRNRFELPREDARAYDILLFTEVGSEGLDYQFCNTMINYDLPWNPMRIEQRIGRIDRRGQKSEYVNIYNLITCGTVDADIYNRCLMRIGVFEKSIGECEEILGEIGQQIEQIAVNAALTDEERRQKLEQMADNEVRRIQELNRLEDDEKELFGFDLSEQAISREIQNAESPWLSQKNLQRLILMYLNARVGKGVYILGDTESKTLRLSASAREIMRDDLTKLTGLPVAMKRKWDSYLKGPIPTLSITFDSDYASRDRNASFITSMHPLVKQAAMYFAVNAPVYIGIQYSSDDLPKGEFAFSIYAWRYVGDKPHFKLTTVCENDSVAEDFMDIIQSGISWEPDGSSYEDRWNVLEGKHIRLWQEERAKNAETEKVSASYKLESLANNARAKRKAIENQLRDAVDERLIRMKQSELENAEERYQASADRIKRQVEQADIHTTLIANGVIRIG